MLHVEEHRIRDDEVRVSGAPIGDEGSLPVLLHLDGGLQLAELPMLIG